MQRGAGAAGRLQDCVRARDAGVGAADRGRARPVLGGGRGDRARVRVGEPLHGDHDDEQHQPECEQALDQRLPILGLEASDE